MPMSAQRVSAGLDLMYRLAKDYESRNSASQRCTVNGVDVAIFEQQWRCRKPFCRLLRFRSASPTTQRPWGVKNQPTVLVVAPLSGHHSTLAARHRARLLHDHKVFITDWTDARMVPSEVDRSTSRRLCGLRAGVHPATSAPMAT